MGDYSAPISLVDIQKPPPNFQSEVLRKNSNRMKTKKNGRVRYVNHDKNEEETIESFLDHGK